MNNRSVPQVRLDTFRSVLEASGLSLADIGRALGVSRQYVSMIVLGRRVPTVDFQRQVPVMLAKRLNLDPANVRTSIFTYPKGGAR